MPTPLTAELLWKIPRVGTPVVGGGRVVVPVTTADLGENRIRSQLWEIFADGREPRRLTSGESSKPGLSPDGTRLTFLRKVGNRTQVHLMPMDGGEPEPVTELPLGAMASKWTHDGHHLVVLAPLYADQPTIDGTARERDRRKNRKHSARVSERAVFRYWDRWLDDGEVPHVFLLDPESRELVDLTPGSTRWMRWENTWDPIDDIDLSPDGRHLAWVADRSEHPHGEIRWALYLTDLESGDERCLTAALEGHASRPRFSDDGAALLYGRTHDPHFYADRVHLVLHDLDAGTETDLTPDWDRSPAGWCFDGDQIVFVAEDHARQPVWRLSPDGAISEVVRDGVITNLAVVEPGRYVGTRSRITAPPEVVSIREGTAVPITSFTSGVGFDPPAVDEVRFTGAGGDEIQMWLVTPPGGLPSPAPLTQMIHGGPHSAWTDVWHWRWHPAVFCGSSRRVALVNFHGSTGWGQDFCGAIRGEWGEMPAADIEAASDLLVEDGVADPQRIAIAGGSYGGYLSAWLTSQTDRYACAIAHAAVTNLPNMYASDLTSGRADAYGAEVWIDLDRVNRWSPAAHAKGYTTPTLVVHGERDYRVPVGQGLELYGVLRAKGVDARLVYYPDENHWILTPANSIHWYGEVTAWLRRHIG